MLMISRSAGTGGSVKSSPEDFIVKEITSHGKILEQNTIYTPETLDEAVNPNGKFTTFVLQKKEWNTIQALTSISKSLGHGRKSIGYSGVKDRMSISTQLASIFGIEPSQVQNMHLKDISINGAWKSDGVTMGSNLGNSFETVIRNPERTDTVGKTLNELNGRMPNYFDKQRFGMRLNNAKVGLHILKGEHEEAVMEYLTGQGSETNDKAIEARKQLKETQDFQAALTYFPRYLKEERNVISRLSQEKDYPKALRSITRGILIMFIHAVESYIFNMTLEERIKANDFKTNAMCGADSYGFPDDGKISESGPFSLAPLVGYNTNDTYITDYEKSVMQKMGITKESFKIKSMPELSMKGDMRVLVTSVKDIGHNTIDEGIKLKFSIPGGSYATIFMNEITKSENVSTELLV